MSKGVVRLKIAICDDDEFCRERLTEMMSSYADGKANGDISFGCFAGGEDLLEAAKRIGGFDIYILDIVMPELNGIELGLALRREGYDGKIIYLTSSEEFAIDSFKVKAYNYLLKPIREDALFPALDEAIKSISSRKEKSFIVKTKNSSIKLSFDSIMYAELCNRSIVYHLTNGGTVESILIRTSFSEAVQELLRDGRFVLCGASAVANMHHITMVEKDALLFTDNSKMYLSRRVCGEIRSGWIDYWFDGEGK